MTTVVFITGASGEAAFTRFTGALPGEVAAAMARKV